MEPPNLGEVRVSGDRERSGTLPRHPSYFAPETLEEHIVYRTNPNLNPKEELVLQLADMVMAMEMAKG